MSVSDDEIDAAADVIENLLGMKSQIAAKAALEAAERVREQHRIMPPPKIAEIDRLIREDRPE